MNQASVHSKQTQNHQSALFKCSTGMRLKKTKRNNHNIYLIPSSLPDLGCCPFPGTWAGLVPMTGMGAWPRRGGPSFRARVHPLCLVCSVWDHTPSCTQRMGAHPLPSRTLESSPSRQGSWWWGPQFKSPSWECSLLGPLAGVVAQSGMSLEGRGGE